MNRGRSSSEINETNVEPLDMEEVPPLSSYVSIWAFWWKFSSWPLVFCIVNGVVFGTLVVFDEFEYNSRRDPRFQKMSGGLSYPPIQENTYLSMLRFNATVFAIALLLDAIVLYMAANFVEKDAMAWDETINDVERETHQSENSKSDRHVHAQVSRKLDVILGRASRPRDSFLVSMLLLSSMVCAAFGVVSIAEWSFTWTPTANKVCRSSFQESYRESTADDKEIKGIPSDLQGWAKTRNEAYTAGFVQLEDKTTFLVATDPRYMPSNDSFDDDSYQYQSPKSTQVLVSMRTDGTTLFYSTVTRPRSFVRLTELEVDDPLNARGFCCVYEAMSLRMQKAAATSMLCVDTLDAASARTNGIFRNVTFESYGGPHGRGNGRSLELASLKWYTQSIWVKLVYYDYRSNGRYVTDFYNVTMKADSPLQLTKVSTDAQSLNVESEWYGMLGGGTPPCTHWRNKVQAGVLMISLVSACSWLARVHKTAIWIVPALSGVVVASTCISSPLALTLCTLAAIAAFVTLHGCGVPILVALGAEELVWFLYTSVISACYIGSRNEEKFALIAFAACSLVGAILGHPTLYLVGWMGGIGALLGGVFLIFVHQRVWGIKLICIGVIGGPGCITVGLLLTKYWAYLNYYAKQAWRSASFSVHAAVHGSRVPQGSSVQRNDDESPLTAGLLHRNC
jgi:hypothetical protein